MARTTRDFTRGSDGDGVQPIRGDFGATILGLRNIPIEHENPDMIAAPLTDSGTIPNLKFSFSGVHNRLLTGGWNFIADIHEGDLWNFPAGLPHSIQALEDGCEFPLVFDSGSFSENETFLITDWFAHTPRDVLAKNFGVQESAFDEVPTDFEHERYIFNGKAPGPMEGDVIVSPAGPTPVNYAYRLLEQTPIKVAGGSVRIVDSTNFPPSQTIAAALVDLEPGALRELHWHPNDDEWQYYISGTARMTVFASSGKARTFDYQAGDVRYVPFAMGHYVQNIGGEPVRFLEMFRSSQFADVSLNQWMALTPPELVKAHLNIDDKTIRALSKDKPIIVK